jgi:hypothetical protein
MLNKPLPLRQLALEEGQHGGIGILEVTRQRQRYHPLQGHSITGASAVP